MMITIIGGSDSGKSAYAESVLLALTEKTGALQGRKTGENAGERFYLATMEPYGEEAEQKIARHRKQRAGKKIKTIACYRNLKTAVKELEKRNNPSVLLECMTNLTANEMFSEEVSPADGETPYEKICDGILGLKAVCENLVVVTGNLFADGIIYAEETEEYRKLLGRLNCFLGKESDILIEVKAGKPIFWKGEAG